MAKYATRCKVCNSPHRNEIETLLAQGWGTPRISQWLKDTYSEEISHKSIYKHKMNHWNVQREIAARISTQQSQELFEQQVQKGITRIESLRNERQENQKLADQLRLIFFDLIQTGEWKTINPETLKALQGLYNTATSQVRASAAEEFRQLDQNVEDPMAQLLELIADGRETENADDSEEA